ncbi:MAG: VOC family protein [Enhydrobacter sp.]|nr:MAG: VOC family protein [Enhydrobacter sp.]
MADLNHLIVWVRDKAESARFLAGVLGVEPGAPWGPFIPVRTANGVTLDFIDSSDVRAQHYAFLVNDSEFDSGLSWLRRKGVAIYSHPDKSGVDEINTYYGGRGFYFEEPSGHLLELITRPYGDAPP